MPSYLITGSSRGLGLAFVVELVSISSNPDREQALIRMLQLKNPANKVVASARNTASSRGLQELASKYTQDRLILLDLDVTKPKSIQDAAEELTKLLPQGLGHLVSNAGISHQPLATFENGL
jgi:NAD(P)-dependent dehydrogenase (short-subunit alcohol dehydrogenase family)